MQGIISPSARPAARSKSSRFMVPPIQVVPIPSDHAYSTSFSKEKPKATSAYSPFLTFPATYSDSPVSTGLERPFSFASSSTKRTGTPKGLTIVSIYRSSRLRSSALSGCSSKLRTLFLPLMISNNSDMPYLLSVNLQPLKTRFTRLRFRAGAVPPAPSSHKGHSPRRDPPADVRCPAERGTARSSWLPAGRYPAH